MSSIQEVNKSIKENNLENLYYIYGADVLRVKNLTDNIVKKILGASDDTYNFHYFEGKEFNFEEFYNSVIALPFFAEQKCVVVNDLNLDEAGEQICKSILETLSEIPPTTKIIFNYTGVDITGGKKLPKGKNKKLHDFIAKTGCVCDVPYKSPDEISKDIMVSAKRKGSEISRADAMEVARLCLCNTLLISNEVQKLCDYADGRPIDSAMISMLVTKQLDSNSFALARAVASSNAKTAIVLLDELFAQRVEAVAVLSAISMAFVDLYRARSALSFKKVKGDILADFTYGGRGFAVDNALRDCRRLSLERIRFCLDVLRRTDLALKSSRVESRLLIEKAIVEMVAGQNKTGE